MTSRALGRFGLGLSPSGVFLQGSAVSTLPAEVISVTNQATPSALLTVTILDISGVANGDTFTDVIPIPFPEFIVVGDKGTFSNAPVASGAFTVFGKFFFSNRERFLRFV
jgi:hypothetical protein